jgi:hypothetical protein
MQGDRRGNCAVPQNLYIPEMRDSCLANRP